jgi:ketosteroid isomerase-like protein
MAHPNADTLRQAYDAFEKGDMDTLRGLFQPDAVAHVAGDSPVSGDYKGVDEIFGFFGQLFERSGGTFRSEVHAILADDEHGTVLTRVSGQREGKSLGSNDLEIFHLRDGKIAEFWSLSTDLGGRDEFWS